MKPPQPWPRPATQPAYDPVLALDLAEHAIAIYDASNGYERWCRARSFVGADTVVRGATQIGIAYGVERIVVAVRGSSQFGDWLDDFLPFRLAWRGVVMGRIHMGFRMQAMRVAADVLATIHELRKAASAAKVYITGHSLGGALCSLLRCILEAGGVDIAATYTFESPRVGNAAWASWYDGAYGDNSFRVVNINAGEQDIVTRVPLSCLGWRHVGRPIMLNAGRAYESEALWEAERRSHPITASAHLRFIRRAWLSVSAHLGASLLAELRAQDGTSRRLEVVHTTLPE